MTAWPYVWWWRKRPVAWDQATGAFRRLDRKGQRCRVVARGSLGSVLVEFPDGYCVLTSRHAVRRTAVAFAAPPEAPSCTPEDAVAHNEMVSAVRTAVRGLSQRLATVVVLRFGLYDNIDRTRKEVAARIECDERRAMWIERQALRRLRHPSISRRLREVLP